ncbi:urea ABC transporter permease subunit UrtC [soil metagenome]
MSIETAPHDDDLALGHTAPDHRAPVEAPPSEGAAPAVVSLTPPGSVNPWLGRAGLVALAMALLAGPSLLDDPTRVRQWAEYLCYAMIAVGLAVAWGRGGMLALGQGVFFGLGAYAMGMYLTLEQVPAGGVPEFMSLYGQQAELPVLWAPFRSFWFAAAAAVLVPLAVAALLGWLVFRNRIRGPYFAILTQALTLVFWLLLVGQLELTNGTNGLTNFRTTFGRNRYEPGTSEFFYFVAAGCLLAIVLLARQVVRSRYGRLLVATRDNENRVRFLGYDPTLTKTVAFVVAAGMAGVAGALSAPIIGLVAPAQFAAIPSILMIAWVAVGGRASVYGALAGALLIGWTRTNVSESRPEDWLYVQGLLFVVVIAWFPGGLAGMVHKARERYRPPAVLRRRSGAHARGAAPPSPTGPDADLEAAR